MKIESLLSFKLSSANFNRDTVKPDKVDDKPSFPESVVQQIPESEQPTILPFVTEYNEVSPSVLEEIAWSALDEVVDFDDVETCDDFVEVEDDETDVEEERRRRVEEVASKVDNDDDELREKKGNKKETKELVEENASSSEAA